MGAEYELKYQAKEACQAAIEAEFSGHWESIAMQTTYYDTPSGSLSAKRYMLRKRFENGVSVCTLKTPAGNARGEWETECEDIHAAITELLAMGAPEDLAALAKEGLVPICGAKFTRLAKTLTLPDCTVELALDQGVLLGGRKEEALCEAEVELKDGTPAACDTFARELADRFGLVAEKKSKFARALRLYKGE